MEKNVASQKIQLFAFDVTNGNPKTGDAANLTAYVSKDHGAVTVLGDTSATEMDATNAKGVYVFDLTQAETNANELTFTAKSTTANISITPRFVTTTPVSFQAFVTPTGATVAAVTGAVGSVTGAVGSVTGLTASDVGAIKTKTDFLPSATAGAAGGVFIAGSNAATSITTALTANVIGNVTGNLSGSVGSVTGAVGSVTGLTASDVGAIKTKTDFLPSATAGAAGGVFIAGSNAATSITTALTANVIGNVTGNLSGSVGSVTGAVGSVTGAVGSVTGAVGSVTGNVGGNVTGSVGSVAAGGIAASSFAAGAIDAAAIATDAIDADALKADAVTEIQSGLSTLNAAGVRTAVGLASANLDTQLDALPTAAENADAVWDEAIAGHAGAGSTGLALANATAPSAATVADAVWDEVLSGHAGVGSAGASLSAAGSAGDPWSTALPGAYGAGTAGKIVGDNINATISSRATQTGVDDLPTNAELSTALGTADDAVLAAVATLQTTADAIPTNAELATALGTADDAVLAQVALVKAKTDLIPASPSAVGDVPTTAQIADKILGRNLAGGSDTGRLVKDALRSLRNKSAIVAGTLTVYEEDDTTPAWTGVITTAPGDPLTSIDPA